MKPTTWKLTLIIFALWAFVLNAFAAGSRAPGDDTRLDNGLQKFQAGEFDTALQELEPLLRADASDQAKDLARSLAARILHARGEDYFRHERIIESIADFDRELKLRPNYTANHWQRGIALYYAGEYKKASKQFKLHETVNPQDVENAAWHCLCNIRAFNGSIDAARKSLIRVTDDPRIPMAQIQQMFAGAMNPDDVLHAAADAGGLAKFYADLYVGLYYEALGRSDESLALIALAAKHPAAKDHYMGDVARVHLALRTKSQQAIQASNQKLANGESRKIHFLAGAPSHGYGAHDHWAGCKLLSKSLDDSGLHVETVIHRNRWPQDATLFKGVDCIVIYADGGNGHIVNQHLAEMDKLMKLGVGLVCLHYAVEVPEQPTGQKFLEWIGGYFQIHWSVNPHWTASFAKLPDHPITRGVKPFRINDEWYYHMRFRENMRGVTPILTDLPPLESLARPDGPASGNRHVRAAIARNELQHMAWAVEREDGGRGFGFTGGHVHWNWADPNFRKLVLNAIVWCAKVEIPRDGVVDEPKTLVDMEANMDEDVPSDFDREAIRKKYALPPMPAE